MIVYLVGAGKPQCLCHIQLQIPPRSEILHALSTTKFFVPYLSYFILASLEKLIIHKPGITPKRHPTFLEQNLFRCMCKKAVFF